jgi:peptidyl-prolyl cis-trans isomerase B (cyclophilin B)
VPTDKRARKRAAREAKMAALQRQRRRRARTRRVITIVVVVGVIVGVYVLLKPGPKAKPKPKARETAQQIAQQAADKAAVAGGCASSPKTVLHKPSWKSPPAMTIDTAKTYTATVKTDAGTFVITLDATQSPIAVNSFVFLAQNKFFNCVTFHRVIPGFVVQGGDPTGTGSGNPGYAFTEKGPAKTANPAQQYPLGSVAMANSNQPATTDPTTNGSQFFIVTGSQGESLGPDYTLFGQVTSGMSVVDKISADGSASGVPPKVTHRMLSVTISSS